MRGWSTRTTETRSLWCILWTCIVSRRIVPTGRILLLIGICALTIPKHYVCRHHRPYTIWSTILWFSLQIVQSGQYILVLSLVTCQVLLTDTLLTLCREGCSYHKESIPEIRCCPTQTKQRCPSPAMVVGTLLPMSPSSPGRHLQCRFLFQWPFHRRRQGLALQISLQVAWILYFCERREQGQRWVDFQNVIWKFR